MEDYIMRKITFITLVMILGMSSVSFGKSYLCISEIGNTLYFIDGKYKNTGVIESKFVVKTEDNDNRMVSVKEFGKDNYFCKDGGGGTYGGGKNVSIRGGNILTCRVPYIKEYGGHTKKEFILDLKFLRFDFYQNFDNSKEPFFGNITLKGKCEEI